GVGTGRMRPPGGRGTGVTVTGTTSRTRLVWASTRTTAWLAVVDCVPGGHAGLAYTPTHRNITCSVGRDTTSQVRRSCPTGPGPAALTRASTVSRTGAAVARAACAPVMGHPAAPPGRQPR